jgi:glycosyltransferase involved in cell wall biosynthesis
LPSRSEACPLVLFEALACGLPVAIAGTVGGNELISADCGVVVADPNDVAGWRATIQELLANTARRAAMGKAARTLAERHSWREMGDRYLALYREFES